MTDSTQPLEGTPLIAPSSTDHPLYEQITEACRTVYDPEIPVNIYVPHRARLSRRRRDARLGRRCGRTPARRENR